MAAAFRWLMACLTWNGRMGLFNPGGVILGSLFLASAIVVFIASFHVTPDSPWRKDIDLDDETLKSI